MSVPDLSNPSLRAWAAIALVALLLIYLLSPILAPFLLGAILAYILDPIVERVSALPIGRTFAVILVMLALIALVAAFALVVLPVFYRELRLLGDRLPEFLAWLNAVAAPWLGSRFGIDFRFDVDSVKQLATDFLSDNQGIVSRVLSSLRVGGTAVLTFVANLLLVPIVLFYLLRDWHSIIGRIDRLLPRRSLDRTHRLLAEVDSVLAEFLRGQILVILAMSVFYVTALSIAGLEFALPIGLIAGVLVFIPYVGAIAGFVLATIAALLQFGSLAGVAWVWVAFAAGQALEGFVLTPTLVGERIGLHPVAVIFALLAFGQLFGFFGVLAALPASAVLLVGLRELKRLYLESTLYGDRTA